MMKLSVENEMRPILIAQLNKNPRIGFRKIITYPDEGQFCFALFLSSRETKWEQSFIEKPVWYRLRKE